MHAETHLTAQATLTQPQCLEKHVSFACTSSHTVYSVTLKNPQNPAEQLSPVQYFHYSQSRPTVLAKIHFHFESLVILDTNAQ